ncbi:MAG: SurA N-terminal domain-containing protein [Bacteroidales bacterium]|nr:SurA N-terminal domain-containing protein [Bacteroidales bacterium]
MGVLIAVVIGFALLAFILGDFLSSGSKLLNSKKFEIASIDGKSVSYQDFQARVETSVENYKNNSGKTSADESTRVSIRNQVWNTLLNEYIMKDQFDELGIGCSGDELFDMIQGTNIHPQIKSADIFRNKVTGEFDRALVIQFLKNMENDPSGRTQTSWVQFEKELMNDRVYTKYQNMIMKGLFVTHDMVENDYYASQRKYSISYVSKRYNFVPDSLVTVDKVDVEKYYAENKDDFTQESTRDIAFVTFDVLPSEKDRKLVETWINNEKPEFQRIENAEQYVNLNGDTGFDPIYYDADKLDEPLRIWAEDAKVADMYGPYFVDEVWKLAKVTDIKIMPDSVRASHILIRPDENNDFAPAQKTADSLLNLIKNGADFAALAAKFGTDGTAQTGGDLNWFVQGAMLPEFSEVCFFGEKGDLETVKTKYGIHVIKVTDQSKKTRKLQVAILDRAISPGQETYQEVYSEASRFAANHNTAQKFEEGILKENLTKRVANNLRESDRTITGLDNPRRLIIDAFEAKKGSMLDLYELANRFVVVEVTEVREEGIAPLDQVYGEVESLVRNKAKGEYLVKQFTEGLKEEGTLEALATKFNVDVRTADDITFGAFSIPGIGVEPVISANLDLLKLNELSKPLQGNNGVYVMKITHRIEPVTQLNYAEAVTRLSQAYNSRAGYQAFQALEKTAKVVDRRNKFY